MVPSMTGTQALFQPSLMLGEPKAVSPEKVLILSPVLCVTFCFFRGKGMGDPRVIDISIYEHLDTLLKINYDLHTWVYTGTSKCLGETAN